MQLAHNSNHLFGWQVSGDSVRITLPRRSRLLLMAALVLLITVPFMASPLTDTTGSAGSALYSALPPVNLAPPGCWDSSQNGCICCGSTLICSDGSVGEFNPECMGGPPPPPPPPDTTPPVTTSSLGGTLGNNGWYTTPVTVSLSATDNRPGAIQTYLDGAPYTAPVTYSGQGVTTISYYSVDKKGNTETAQTSTFQIDTVAPGVAITNPPASGQWFAGTVTISGTADDATSGLSQVEISTDGGSSWQAASGTAAWTFGWDTLAVLEGDYTVIARATDMAGNVATSTTIMRVDNTAPTVGAILSGKKGKDGWWVGPVTVTLTASDGAGSGVASITLNGQTYTGPVTISAAGTSNLTYFATDLVGNSSAPQSLSLKMDNQAPYFLIDPFAREVCFACGETLAFHLTMQDDPSGVLNTAILIYQNGTLVRTLKAPDGPNQDFVLVWDGKDDKGNLLPDGSYFLQFFSGDKAGNIASYEANVTIVPFVPVITATPAPVVPGVVSVGVDSTGDETEVYQPTPMPTRTPYPTATPRATVTPPSVALVPPSNGNGTQTSSTTSSGGIPIGDIGGMMATLALLTAAYTAATQTAALKTPNSAIGAYNTTVTTPGPPPTPTVPNDDDDEDEPTPTTSGSPSLPPVDSPTPTQAGPWSSVPPQYTPAGPTPPDPYEDLVDASSTASGLSSIAGLGANPTSPLGAASMMAGVMSAQVEHNATSADQDSKNVATFGGATSNLLSGINSLNTAFAETAGTGGLSALLGKVGTLFSVLYGGIEAFINYSKLLESNQKNNEEVASTNRVGYTFSSVGGAFMVIGGVALLFGVTAPIGAVALGIGAILLAGGSLFQNAFVQNIFGWKPDKNIDPNKIAPAFETGWASWEGNYEQLSIIADKAVAEPVGDWAFNTSLTVSNTAFEASQKVTQAVESAAQSVTKTTTNIANGISSAAKSAAQKVQSAANSVNQWTQTTAQNINVAVANTTQGIAKTVSNTASGIISATQAISKVVPAAAPIAKTIGVAANNTAKWAIEASENVTQTVKQATSTVSSVVNKVTNTVTQTANKAATFVSNTANKTATWVNTQAKSVATSVSNTANKVATTVSSVATKASSTISSVTKTLANVFKFGGIGH